MNSFSFTGAGGPDILSRRRQGSIIRSSSQSSPSWVHRALIQPSRPTPTSWPAWSTNEHVLSEVCNWQGILGGKAEKDREPPKPEEVGLRQVVHHHIWNCHQRAASPTVKQMTQEEAQVEDKDAGELWGAPSGVVVVGEMEGFRSNWISWFCLVTFNRNKLWIKSR